MVLDNENSASLFAWIIFLSLEIIVNLLLIVLIIFQNEDEEYKTFVNWQSSCCAYGWIGLNIFSVIPCFYGHHYPISENAANWCMLVLIFFIHYILGCFLLIAATQYLFHFRISMACNFDDPCISYFLNNANIFCAFWAGVFYVSRTISDYKAADPIFLNLIRKTYEDGYKPYLWHWEPTIWYLLPTIFIKV